MGERRHISAEASVPHGVGQGRFSRLNQLPGRRLETSSCARANPEPPRAGRRGAPQLALALNLIAVTGFAAVVASFANMGAQLAVPSTSLAVSFVTVRAHLVCL